MNNQEVTKIIETLDGVTFKQWQVIEKYVNDEFKRQANKNTLTNSEGIVKNIMLDIN